MPQAYNGCDLQWRASGLDARTEYTIRVAAVRIPASRDGAVSRDSTVELVGAFSPPGTFVTLAAASDGGSGNNNKHHVARVASADHVAEDGGPAAFPFPVRMVRNLFYMVSSSYYRLHV